MAFAKLLPQRKAIEMRESDPGRMRQRLIEIVRRSKERTALVTVTPKAVASSQKAKSRDVRASSASDRDSMNAFHQLVAQ